MIINKLRKKQSQIQSTAPGSTKSVFKTFLSKIRIKSPIKPLPSLPFSVKKSDVSYPLPYQTNSLNSNSTLTFSNSSIYESSSSGIFKPFSISSTSLSTLNSLQLSLSSNLKKSDYSTYSDETALSDFGRDSFDIMDPDYWPEEEWMSLHYGLDTKMKRRSQISQTGWTFYFEV